MELTEEQIAWIENEVYVICPLQKYEDQFCAKRKKKVSDLRAQVKQSLINRLIKENSSMVKSYSGVSVDTDHPTIQAAKNVDDVIKIGLFGHLTKDEEKALAKELLEDIKPKKKVEEPKPAEGQAM